MAYDYAAARQAGVSDSDIIAALADRHNYDLKAARKSRVADSDILGALLERENSGAISQEMLAPDRSLSIPKGFTEGAATNHNLEVRAPDRASDTAINTVVPVPQMVGASVGKFGGDVIRWTGDAIAAGGNVIRAGLNMQPADTNILQRAGKAVSDYYTGSIKYLGDEYYLPDGSVASGVRGGLQSTGEMLSTWPLAWARFAKLSAAGSNVMQAGLGAGEAAITALSAKTSADAYDKYADRGHSFADATAGGLVEGVIEKKTEEMETLPFFEYLSNPRKAGLKALGKAYAKLGLTGQLTEQLATLGQDVTDKVMGDPGMTLEQKKQTLIDHFNKEGADGLTDFERNAKQTAIATATMTTVMGGVGGAAKMLSGQRGQTTPEANANTVITGAGSKPTGTPETGAQGAGQPVPGGPAAGLAPQDDYELQQALQTSAPAAGPGAVAADLPGAEPVTAPVTTPVPAEPVGTLAKAAQVINPYAQLAGQPFANAPTEQPTMPSMPPAARGLTVNTLQAPTETDLAQEWAQREIANPATTGNERKNLQFMLNDRNPQKLELVRYWRSFTNQAKPVAGRGLFDAKQPLAAPTVARDSVPPSPTVSAATAVPVAAGQQTPEPAAAATSSAVVGDGVDAGVKRGEIGMKLGAGERVLTASGRPTTPFPKINTATNKTTLNTMKRVDQWLIDNAIDEARARGDKFNQRQFAANRDKPSQADKDGAELYLFGDKQPDVVPSILKPMAPEGSIPVSQNTPAATIDQDQKTAQAQPGVAAPENDGAKTTETAIVEEGGTDNAETEVLTTNAGSDREAGREESGGYLQDAARYARGVHGSVRALERQEYPQPGQVELKGEQKEVFDAIKAAEVDVLEQLMEQRGAFPSAGFVAAWKAQGSKGETEHKVALAPDHKTIRKFGTAAANHTWADYLDRISHHNQLFSKTPYTFLGLSEIDGQLHAVIDQPYIFGDHIIKAPVEVIDQHLLGLGLKPYVRPQYAGKPTEVSAMARLWIDPVSRVAVWDVRPANVLYDTTVKTAYFIDPIIEPLPKGFDVAGLTPLDIADDGTVTGSKFQMIDGEVIPLDLERPTLGRNERGNIDLRFPGRPDDEVIQRLTATGFKFNQKEKTWYAGDTAEARALAEELAGSSLPPAREDSKSAQAKPSRQRIRNILNDIRQAGGIKLQSLIDALDRNEVMGPSGRGNRYLRVTGGKGNGFGLDQMARMMLEQGWSVPVDLNGEADADAFAQLLKDAINGDLPVHPDDTDQVVARQEDAVIQQIEAEEIAAVGAIEDEELFDEIHVPAGDEAVAEALAFFDQFGFDEEAENGIDPVTDSSVATADEGATAEGVENSSGPEGVSAPGTTGGTTAETKPLTEVVSASGEVQNKLFATPPTFGKKPQKGAAVGTSDLLDNFTSEETVQPSLLSAAAPAVESPPPVSVASLKEYDGLNSRMITGEISPAELRAAFASFSANLQTIQAELAGLKKDDILSRMGSWSAYRYKSEKKDVVVRAALEQLQQSFMLDKTLSYMMGAPDARQQAIQKAVNSITSEDIAAYAKGIAQHRQDIADRRAKITKAIENPETLEEFTTYLKTGRKVEDLPADKRQLYDELVAANNREKQAQDQLAKNTVTGVDTGATTFSMVEGKHSKTGETLYVVQLDGPRLDDAGFKQLAQKARQLGGNYVNARQATAWKTTAGFQFKSQARAEQFMALQQGDVVKEDTSASKQNNAAAKLREVATSLKEKAEADLSRDRLSNTARRAAMANSAEESARRDIALAETMLNLADAIERGDATHLNGISAKTHVEQLQTLLNRAKWRTIRNNPAESMTNDSNRPARMEDIDQAEYPYPAIWGNHLRDVYRSLEGVKGAVKLRAWLSKATRNFADELITFNGADEIENLRNINTILQKKGKKWEFEKIKTELMEYDRTQRIGIPDLPTLRAALREFLQYRADKREADRAKQLERSLVGQKVGQDFFPTPPAVAEQMVELAGITPGMKVLEPSAGNGNIAMAMQEAGAEVEVAEISSSLREVLEAKGFTVVAQDFMELTDGDYDAIVMNPPFSNNQDIEHVRHAYTLLKPGGKLVAIVGEGAFFRNGTTEEAFRGWLDEQDAEIEKLPEGTFTDRKLLNTTGANARMVVLEKPAEKSAAAPAEVADQQQDRPVAPTEKITDFGEKLGGARKDFATKFADAKNLDIATEPFSKTWPEPDYQKMLDQGFSQEDVALVRAIRDEIPDKPRKSYKLSSWVNAVSNLRDHAEKLLAGEGEHVRTVLERDKANNRAAENIMGRTELYQAVGHGVSLRGITIRREHWQLYNGRENVWLWQITQPQKATAYSNMPRILGEGDTKEQAIAAFAAKMETLEPKARTTRFEVYSYRSKDKPGFYIGKKSGRDYVDLKHFDTVEEARTFHKNNFSELVAQWDAMKTAPFERREVNAPRIGENIREGKDATPEMFMDAFGFRGVEFGNWVKGQERQDNLNDAFDALHDLAAIIGIPTKGLSLNGELGLAFGARGTGGIHAAAAHYEPGKVVINLTKKSGAGSLAHEWFHAFDSYLSRKRGKGNDFIADHAVKYGPNDETRQELIDALVGLRKALDVTGMKARARNLDKTRTKDYWSTGIEMHARAFENYVIDRLTSGGKSNDYLANIKDISEYADAMLEGFAAGKNADELYPYLLDSEIEGVRKAFDNLFATLKTKETERGVALFHRLRRAPGYQMDATAVGSVIDRVTAGWRQSDREAVILLERFEDLPAAVLKEADKAGYNNADPDERIYGVAYQGKIYLLHENLFSAYDVEEALLHERLHLAVRSGGKQKLVATLNSVLHEMGGGKGLLELADQAGFDFGPYREQAAHLKRDERAAFYVEEFLANVEGRRAYELLPQKALRAVRELWGAFRQWLQENGFTQLAKLVGVNLESYTQADLAYLLRGIRSVAIDGQRSDAVRFMIAWHGSPHDHDKFDSSKIGTGEGAQAYGYGLYFAGSKEVAEYYRKKLSGDALKESSTKPVLEEMRPAAKTSSASRLVTLISKNNTLNDADIKSAGLEPENFGFQDIDDEVSTRGLERYGYGAYDAIRGIEVGGKKYNAYLFRDGSMIADDGQEIFAIQGPKGRLYQVELAPAEDEYLLWDKPLSEQSEKVKAAVTKAGFAGVLEPEQPTMNANRDDVEFRHTGEWFYRVQEAEEGSDKAASEYLHSLGIRGIKYLDGTSRGKGEGNYNYVIFSDEDVTIVTKFSLADVDTDSYAGMRAAELRKEFGDRIQVIQTPDQMPDVAKADAEAMGVKPWQIEAFVHSGQVWLVAENIRSMSRARVLAFGHELAHLGQDEKVVDLAEAWFKATESDASEGFKKVAHDLLQEEAAKRKLDLSKPEHYREAVREATARLAEDMAKNGVKPGLIQKIVNQLRQLLRQMYGKLRVTDQELAGAVAEMLRIGEKKLGDSSNPDIRFSLRDDIAKAVEQIDWQQVIDATRNNWLQTLNPLDWSRSWGFMQDALPENVKAAFGWFFMNPVFQAERDPAKRPFVEAGETRELNRMQIMLDFLGFNPGQEDKRSAAKKTWDFVTSWQNGQVSTDWEDLNQRMFALTKAQKKALDFLVAEGDAMGSEYDSLAQARLNPRIAKQAGMDQAVFDLYRAVRRHIEHVREVRIKQMDAMLREVPDMTDKEREKHIADYRNSDRQVRGWMPRHHGEGREQVAVYHLFDAEELNDSWVTTPLFDKDGEPVGDQFFLPFYPGSRAMQAMEQRIKEGWTEAKAKITTTAKGHVVVTIHGDSSGAMEDIQVAIADELQDDEVRVMAYMRRFQTRRGAEKHAEKVRADYKGAMPRNYSAARSYQTEVQTVDMLTEDLFQAMKGDMAIEAALKESLKKALKRGELDKDKYEELNDQLVQDTAEVLLSRAAGRYQIRRSPYLIEGYDTEGVMSLYQDYMMGVAGMLSKAQYAMQQYENLRQAKAQVKPWAIGFVFDSLRNMGLGDRISGDIRSFASLWLMGFKISSALINATQPYTMGIAELYRQLPEDGKQSASRLILKAQKDVLTSKNLKNDERQIFDTAVYKQQEMQTALGELSGHNEGTYTKAGQTLQALTGKALALFQNVEVLNRKSVILAGYRAFRSTELAAGALDEAALQKAMEINGKVNFEMGRHNLPGWARGAELRTFYSLQSFTWNSLNWIFNRLTSGQRRDQIALLRYAGVLALLGGMSALPGGDELDKLYRKLRGRSLKLDFQDWTKRQTDRFGTLGEMANAFAWHGLLSAGGYGVQASNAIRLQIPVVSQWLADRSALEAASGVPGALVGKVQTAAMYLQRGYYYRAAESASPEFVAGWLRAIRQYREGATTSHGKKVFDEQGQQIRYSAGDVVKRGLGFQPFEQSKRGELAEQMRKIQMHWNSERAELLDELRGSSGKGRDKVLKRLIEFNQELAESQAAGLVQPITATTVRNGLTYRPNQRQSRWLQQYSD